MKTLCAYNCETTPVDNLVYKTKEQTHVSRKKSKQLSG